MKCVICHGEDILEQHVNEELKAGQDIILAPVTCLVCQTCGERYYDTATMKQMEKLRSELRAGHIPLRQVGKVMSIDPSFQVARAA
jgi:YgiT-type zinc finger domain-containing protein